MQMRYVSLEEAHPPFRRAPDHQMGAAFLDAIERAMKKGPVALPIPDSLRPHVLARKQRHSFSVSR